MAWPLGAAPPAPVRIGVLSDPHYYDTALGTEGAAFEAYLTHDRKLLRESGVILRAALDSVRDQGVSFVVVCGDLTKDGERSSHLGFAQHLADLEAAGVEAYVIPGNHDILNPHAVSYHGAQTNPVPNVTPEEFAAIYAPYGYGQARLRDPESLSYLAEPAAGVWWLAMDACDCRDNLGREDPRVGGGFRRPTLD